MNEELKKQWEQDVAYYGDYEFESMHSRRKDTAALPFDLERAKAGDAVEICIDNQWQEVRKGFAFEKYIFYKCLNRVCYFALNGTRDIIDITNLRMKFPPKVKP